MEQFDRVEPVLMVRDVSQALAFYAQLGFGEVFATTTTHRSLHSTEQG